MKRITLEIALLLLALVSIGCVNTDPEGPKNKDVVFLATRESLLFTKAVLMNNGEIWWEPNDEVGVYRSDGRGGCYKFVSNNSEPSPTVQFFGNIDTGGSNIEYWAVSPYTDWEGYSSDGQSVTMGICSGQEAVANSFSDHHFPAVAKSTNLDFQFRNICGGLGFTFSRSDITRVKIQPSLGEVLSGDLRVSFDSDGEPVVTVLGGEPELWLYAPEEGAFEAGVPYYCSVLPVSLSGGFSLTFYTEDKVGTAIIERAVNIERSSFFIVEEPDKQVMEWAPIPLNNLHVLPDAYFNSLETVISWVLCEPNTSSGFRIDAPFILTYVVTPPGVDVSNYDWYFSDDDSPTEGIPNESTLIRILDGPKQDGQFVVFKAELAENVNPDNHVFHMHAVPKLVSSYVAYEEAVASHHIIRQDNYYYPILSPDNYEYRTRYVDADDRDVIDIKLQHKKEIDLLDYVSAAYSPARLPLSAVGIYAEYEFFYAGKNADGNVVFSKSASAAPYIDSKGKDNNNYLSLNGSRISVNSSAQLPDAVGATPLICVRSFYSGALLSENFIKIEIQ